MCNARLTITEEFKRADTEKRLAKVSRFLREGTCPDCQGSRLNPAARQPQIGELNLAQVTTKTLDDILIWIQAIPATVGLYMQEMAAALVDTFTEMARRLVELGLGYLALDRAGSTLSTGERQRVQLARAVRNRTTGVLYVLNEPSIGLHPVNVDGLLGVMQDLLADGNSVVFVDHDVQLLREADWLIEIGPGSGTEGGTVIAEATPEDLPQAAGSLLAGFLTGEEPTLIRPGAAPGDVFERGTIHLESEAIHTVHPLAIDFPVGRLTAITGVSGSGKRTLLLETLVPAIQARSSADPVPAPAHVRELSAPSGIHAQVVDATPIGQNVRSTAATYSGVMDNLRKAYAATEAARADGLTASDFSYNTGYSRGHDTHPGSADRPRRLTELDELGLGYLTLGEATTSLSGGEAQRLKLVSQMHRDQTNTVFVLDEPSVGLHPLDVRTLLGVLRELTDRGATVIVIEHDLGLIANADHVIDLGPGGGDAGAEWSPPGRLHRWPASPTRSPAGTWHAPCSQQPHDCRGRPSSSIRSESASARRRALESSLG